MERAKARRAAPLSGVIASPGRLSLLFVTFSSSPPELQLEPFHVAKMTKTRTRLEPLSFGTAAEKEAAV